MKTGKPKNTFQILNSYLDKKDKRSIVFILFLFLTASVLEVFGLASLIPVLQIAMDSSAIQENQYIKSVYDFFGFESERMFLLATVLSIFTFFLFKNLFMLGVKYKQLKFTTTLSMKIIKKQFEKYYSLDFWKFNRVGVSTILNHVNRVPDVFSSKYLYNYFQLFTEFIVITIIVLGIAIYKPVLFLLMVIVLGPTTWLVYAGLKGKIQEYGNRVDSLMPEGFSLVNDSFKGYADLKLAGKSDMFMDRYFKNRKKVYNLQVRSGVLNDVPVKAIELIAISGIVLIFIYSLFISSQPEQVLVLLGIFVAASYRIMPSVTRILSSLMTIKNTQYSVDCLELYKDYIKEAEASRSGVAKPVNFMDSIKFQNVGFSYPDASEYVIKNINFEVKRGEKVGFIGRSGSGKTTLINILLRFYEETEGCIEVDGTPLTHEHLESWREKLGYVRQDVFILDGTIEENITLADKHVDQERLSRAIQLSSLKGVMEELSEGTKTHVGENGSRMSGGQKQRIGIARALYHEAEILVFDEATSALDNETEQEITEAINRLSETDITLFIIAHRVTTLKNCNKIFELKDGEIFTQRSYNELLNAVN
ncbi:ABC transporter ATP-binding protein [Rhodohalobacter sp. 8-1]|uniref:ABC transporter ATP-binding protein n=1 Tax=Rhodohalobacter sp. 8-1 TaxID=3131972 RepID=UPI0030EC2AF2